MSKSLEPLLLSLKPRYANLVFDGLKKVELRRRSPKNLEGRDVFVYVTNPDRILRGGFKVGNVWIGSPEEIWEIVSESAGLDKLDFDAYYAGRDVAYAFEIVEPLEYKNPLTLDALKRMFRDFVVPQSWRYVKPEEYRAFRDMMQANAATEIDDHAVDNPLVEEAVVV